MSQSFQCAPAKQGEVDRERIQQQHIGREARVNIIADGRATGKAVCALQPVIVGRHRDQRRIGQQLEATPQKSRLQQVVGTEQHHVVARGAVDGPVPVGGHAHRFRVALCRNAGMARAEPLDQLPGAIAGSVVLHNKLQVRAILPEHGVHRFLQVAHTVVDGYADGDPRCAAGGHGDPFAGDGRVRLGRAHDAAGFLAAWPDCAGSLEYGEQAK